MVAFIDVLDSVVRPSDGSFSIEHATYVLSLGFPDTMKDRCEELSLKAQSGNLSAEESAELDQYLAADSMLAVLKSKARLSIAGHSTPDHRP